MDKISIKNFEDLDVNTIEIFSVARDCQLQLSTLCLMYGSNRELHSRLKKKLEQTLEREAKLRKSNCRPGW